MVSQDENESVQRTFTNWLFGQEANTVALYLILMAIGYGGWWTVTTGIPKHLTQIQEGYQSLDERNSRALEAVQARHSKDIDSVTSTFEKALDRMERSFAEGKK